MSKQFSPKKNVEVICRRKKNVEAIVAEKKVSKQLSPKKNVESNFGRKKNADHIKCRKFQDVVIKRYWFSFLFLPKSNVTDAIQKRIDTLNERYSKNEINIEDFLNALSLLIAQKNEIYVDNALFELYLFNTLLK